MWKKPRSAQTAVSDSTQNAYKILFMEMFQTLKNQIFPFHRNIFKITLFLKLLYLHKNNDDSAWNTHDVEIISSRS